MPDDVGQSIECSLALAAQELEAVILAEGNFSAAEQTYLRAITT
jgi:hypothetical protein